MKLAEEEYEVELHVPLIATVFEEGQYPYPWLLAIEEFLLSQPEEAFDAGTEWVNENGENEYVYFLVDYSLASRIEVARRAARLEGVPKGAYILISDPETDLGMGERIEI